jgi:hypothetical protein
MARLIGEVYFGNLEANANANVWASAFANVGYTGMFGFTVLLGLMFRLIDGMAKHGDFVVTSLMCGMFGLTWTNGGLQTSMLSNGILVTLFVIFFLHPVDCRPLQQRTLQAIVRSPRPLGVRRRSLASR